MIWPVYLVLLVHGVALAAERPTEFAYGVAIHTQSDAALHEIEIPAALYRGVTRADLGDLRIFNGQNEVVPHALRPSAVLTEQKGAAHALPGFPLYGEAKAKLDDLTIRVEKRSDGTIIDMRRATPSGTPAKPLRAYLLDATALKQPIRALQLDWQGGNESFLGHIRIDGSNDLADWRAVVENAALARLSFGGHQVIRNRVEFGPARYQYLRLSWPESQSALAAVTATAETAPSVSAVPRRWQTVAATAQAGKAGEFIYDLGGPFPVDRLRVELPQVNTLAQVQLLARARQNDEWRPATSALVYRLRERETEVTSAEIAINGSGQRYWLLRVDQKGGGVGSGVPALQIGWVAQRLVFAARGGGPFQLAYGGSGVKPAALTIESLIPGFRTDGEFSVQPAKLGEPVTLAGSARLSAPWDYKKIALWSSLLLGVAILGWMATRLMRQLGSSQPPDETK